MATYSVAEARDNIADLIDRVQAGETVTITRRGKPVAEVTRPGAPGKRFDLDWILSRQITPRRPIADGDSSIVQRMRDEDTH